MGVMSCSKKGCEHIMCDTYVNEVGYICQQCQGDFEDWLESNNHHPKNEGDILRFLDEFMKLDKTLTFQGKEVSVQEFFRLRTR